MTMRLGGVLFTMDIDFSTKVVPIGRRVKAELRIAKKVLAIKRKEIDFAMTRLSATYLLVVRERKPER